VTAGAKGQAQATLTGGGKRESLVVGHQRSKPVSLGEIRKFRSNHLEDNWIWESGDIDGQATGAIEK